MRSLGRRRIRFLFAALFSCAPAADGLVKTSDKQALVALYENTGGANWVLHQDAPYDDTALPGGNQGWNLAADPCGLQRNDTWHGVGCIDPCYTPIDGPDCRFGRVTGLNLPFNNLVGTVPDEVYDKLINLTVIDFSHNSLSGTIPTTVGKLRNAYMILMPFNRLSGTIPTEIRTAGSHSPPDENAVDLADIWISGEGENATYDWDSTKSMGLSQIDLSHNNLNGTLPTTIGDLVNLQAVDVSFNPDFGADGCCEDADSYYSSFYGYNTTLPTEIGRLRKLQVLGMDYSRFMRHLPTEIGNMRNLKFWRVMGSFTTNQVSGTIPTQFGKLKRTLEFMMENNTISGSIPTEIAAMESLDKFIVNDNKLSGSLPENIGDLTALSYWDTFGNKMVGDMPSSIQNIGSLDYLYIQNEHTDVARNYYCRERIESSAVGRKYNWQVLANEYINYKQMSGCANPFDVEAAFGALTGDV